MLAIAECSNQWMDNHSIRIPWLNSLTSQSIPEETDSISDCSLSSMDDCYIILNDQHSHSINEEKLNFADINEDEYQMESIQTLIIEMPFKQYAKVKQSPIQEFKSIFELNRLCTKKSNRIKTFYKSTHLSTFSRLIKTCTRSIKSNNNEPVLLQVKYFDGRPPLIIDRNALQFNRILNQHQFKTEVNLY